MSSNQRQKKDLSDFIYTGLRILQYFGPIMLVCGPIFIIIKVITMNFASFETAYQCLRELAPGFLMIGTGSLMCWAKKFFDRVLGDY